MIARVTFAAFVAFWASVATLLALSALAPASVADERHDLREIDAEELAEHASLESCWMAIEGKVYDFTDYIPEHPTPPSVMEPWCGREATEGMRTKGYGRDHSPAAWAMMEDYLIGVFVD